MTTISGRTAEDLLSAEPSGVWARLLGFTADAVLLSVLLVCLVALFEPSTAGRATPGLPLDPLPAWLRGLTSLVGLGYFTLSWAWFGQTPGQRALRLKVARTTNRQSLSLPRAAARWVVLGGPLWIAATEMPGISGSAAVAATCGWFLILAVSMGASVDGRGLHDRWVDTVVVKSRGGHAT